MNFGIETLASGQTLVFCLAIYAFVWCFRKLVEGIGRKTRIRYSYYWREVALPVLPSVIGAIAGATMSFFPYPEGLSHPGSRTLYGLVCGFASGLVYKIALSIVRKLWPGALPSTPSDGSS